MGIFLKIIHEYNNAEKIKEMRPYAIFYNMCHVFTKQKVRSGFINTVAFYVITKKQPFVVKAFSSQEYSDSSLQNKVLLHGIIYNALFNIYTSYLKKSFDSVLLPEPHGNQPIIDFAEYKNLPKSLRGIFVKFDKNNYILNIPNQDIVIAFNKKNKKQLEQLLLRAKALIPVIYKTKEKTVPENDGHVITEPDFVYDSRSEKPVTDEQINTINELNDIFMEIATIAYPTSPRQKELSVAKEMYDSYKKEQQKRNMFFKAKISVDTAKSARKKQIEEINFEYDKKHKEIIDSLKQQTIINTK